mmetsp:Transcript_4243/g.8058  ORF Transcript_4243/g.8058 Transcript_4243/m.8058 type:complete len:227 (+) Transcript_4243:1230-1910(+)
MDIASLLAATVKHAERNLCNDVCVSRWLEVASSTSQQNERTIRVLLQLCKRCVFTLPEEIILQTQSVECVPGSTEFADERKRQNCCQQGPLHNFIPMVLRPGKQANSGASQRAIDAEAHQVHDASKHPHGPCNFKQLLQEAGSGKGHDEYSKGQQDPKTLQQNRGHIEFLQHCWRLDPRRLARLPPGRKRLVCGLVLPPPDPGITVFTLWPSKVIRVVPVCGIPAT